MGFENRKSLRVNLAAQIYFWRGETAHGTGIWGQCVNVSATGMAFFAGEAAAPGDKLLLEVALPDQTGSLHVTAQVVNCQRDEGQAERFQLRVNFLSLENEDRHMIRLYVLQVAEPAMGWGRAYFPGQHAIDAKYRELAASEHQEWLAAKAFLSIKELGFLKKFQLSLEEKLGSKNPENFKLVGSRPLKEHSDVWIEFDLGEGQMHFLAKTLWCRQEKGEKAESGLALAAFHKDEAISQEKGL